MIATYGDMITMGSYGKECRSKHEPRLLAITAFIPSAFELRARRCAMNSSYCGSLVSGYSLGEQEGACDEEHE